MRIWRPHCHVVAPVTAAWRPPRPRLASSWSLLPLVEQAREVDEVGPVLVDHDGVLLEQALDVDLVLAGFPDVHGVRFLVGGGSILLPKALGGALDADADLDRFGIRVLPHGLRRGRGGLLRSK